MRSKLTIRAAKTVFAVAAGAVVTLAGLGGSYVVPLTHDAIQYERTSVDDSIARLQKSIDAGKVKLSFEDGDGYLASVLEALRVPVESQVLVFSKTSFQAPRISPRMPRALYFNDALSVGYVRGGDVIEFAAQDPKQGVIFYTLDQEEVGAPKFQRRDSCLQCHHSGGTLGVPGLIVTSVFPEPSGMPLFQVGSTIVNQETPIEKRWGGWYVTGTHGKQTHRGNAVVRDKNNPEQLETEDVLNQTQLLRKFDTGAYLTPHSDIAALMVLEHQTHMTNLITRVGYETRMAVFESEAINKAMGEPAAGLSPSATRRINNAVEEMLEYMLFAKEAKISEPIRGTSGFAETFQKVGPKDAKGRTLRELDLKSRMFRYPCSYMIYSEAFDAMPSKARDRLLSRLQEVLSGQDWSPKFAYLSADVRRDILEILKDTKKGLTSDWARLSTPSTQPY